MFRKFIRLADTSPQYWILWNFYIYVINLKALHSHQQQIMIVMQQEDASCSSNLRCVHKVHKHLTFFFHSFGVNRNDSNRGVMLLEQESNKIDNVAFWLTHSYQCFNVVFINLRASLAIQAYRTLDYVGNERKRAIGYVFENISMLPHSPI